MAKIILTPDVVTSKIVYQNNNDRISCNIDTSEFLFYSNNPETVKYECLTESKKWLCREDVIGRGQIYTWHRNEVSQQIYTSIVIYNPNKFTVNVDILAMGLTNESDWHSDARAWRDYLIGNTVKTKSIPAGGYLDLYTRPVQNLCNWGIISKISFTDENNNPAKVTLFDIAYIEPNNSGNATEPAYIPSSTDESTPHRGKGLGYVETLNLNLVIENKNEVKAVSIGAKDDSFEGTDLIQVVDSSGMIPFTGLAGSFGVKIKVKLTVQNKAEAGNCSVVIGSIGQYSYPIVFYNNEFGFPTQNENYQGRVDPNKAVKVIDLGWMEKNSTPVKVEFITAVPALSSAPYIIGVYNNK